MGDEWPTDHRRRTRSNNAGRDLRQLARRDVDSGSISKEEKHGGHGRSEAVDWNARFGTFGVCLNGCGCTEPSFSFFFFPILFYDMIVNAEVLKQTIMSLYH